MLIKKIVRLLAVLLVFPCVMQGQVTTSSMSGSVKTGKGEALVGATVTATHVPTGTVYRVSTRTGGAFNIYNMTPGGPYTLTVSFVGFENATKGDIFLSLGENSTQDISLADKSTILTEVVVGGRRGLPPAGKGGSETFIGRDKMANIPSVGRNISDFLTYTPQAKITGDGGVSIAGQNNRYNSFYIDGALNNDVFGIAASGTNGGQANIPPISIDAIDQFQVMISPYDASIGNFTGGGINAITKSGTNDFKGSVWYIFRNEDLAGKSPVAVVKPGSPGVLERTRLNKFKTQNKGFTLGGPIIKNKLFFFILGEVRDDERPQPFNFAEYRGTATLDSIAKLTNFLKNNYEYDPGDFLNNPELVSVDYINAKLDWNISANHRLSLSHRYNNGSRYNTSTSSGTTINFFTNGYIFPTKTNSTSLELRSTLSKGSTNRLLLTLSKVLDDRNPIGQPFPRVSIFDGPGTIVFGTENFSAANLLDQQNVSIFNAYKFYAGKHVLTIGTDNEINRSVNVFIRDYFGTYTYNSLNDFISGAKPRRYQRSFSLLDDNTGESNTNAAAKFKTLKIAFFLNDEIKVNDALTVNLGLRADRTEFLTKPREDKFLNDSGLAKIEQYHDLRGARSGQIATPKWSLSPRIGFTYRMDDESIVIRGGWGMFTGRIPLVWPGGVYNQNGVAIGGIDLNPPTASQNITFRPDPFGQYTSEDFGINLANSRGQVDLIAADFRLPKLWRASLAMDKRLGQGWTLTMEAIYSKNINEIDYKNVNILPPIGKSVGPDVRNVYGLSGPTRIPMRSTGANPYPGNIFLLHNNEGRNGYSYSLTTTIDKAFRNGFAFNANYTYGHSVILHEGTSSQNNSQWANMEVVQGRNFVPLSRSDFDLGHRINAYFSKEVWYANKTLATVVTLTYNGQSGNPYSYVYRNSPISDNSATSTNDLIYVPTEADLANMTFLSNTVNGVTYSAAQQKEMLNQFIMSDRYLRKRRGQHAERNGARQPFTHIVNLALEQKFRVKLSGRRVDFSVRYDVFNFTNLLNKDWGRQWFMSFDQFPLYQFVSYVSAANLTPQYRYTPVNGTPYSLSTSTEPRLSARWMSQLTFRLAF
ncbi:MAG TPA: TonB-dependent receptor [Chitinophagaceae bacterium]|nr:TonB-dependent receptor [Chitinophagaceae bacterium]